MDPLSMTASIIAILQLTTTLTGYINDVRNATEEQAKVAIEASNLYSLLTSLRFRVEAARSDDAWFTQVKLLGIVNGPLDQFKHVLEKMVEEMSSSRKRDKLKSALMWTFTKTEVENALKRMERLKSLIQCALTGDLLTLSQAIHGDVVTLGERTKRLQTYAEQELQHRISQWLMVPDPSTNYRAALEKRHPETGLWLLNGQYFNDWKNSKSSLMWLHGNAMSRLQLAIAGCGKTVLSAAVLESVIQQVESQSDTAVGYFYFDFNDVEKQSSRNAIRSLLFQLSQQVQAGDGVQALEQLYQRFGNGQQQPAEDSIRSLLWQTIDRMKTTYVILDALDECTDREDLLTFISDIVGLKRTGFRAMVTSRREKDIEEQLRPISDYNINIQSAIVDEDIRIYIHDRLATDIKLKKWSESVRNEIVTVMMEKAGGMFRWAFCQLESIRQCVKLSALRKALSSLPRTLDETYNRVLRGLESADQLQDAIKALRWLCFSHRPLLLLEIREVLAIESGDDGGFFPEERLPDPSDIMLVCSSLVSCSAIGDNNDVDDDDNDHDDNKQIRLAHFSVKEYLLSDRCPFRLDFEAKVCQTEIAESCLHYLLHLSAKGPLIQEVVDQHPLARYAAEYWWQHTLNIDGTLDSVLLDLALQLLIVNDAALLSWVQLYDIHNPWKDLNLRLTSKDLARSLYYTALIGVSEFLVNVLRQKVEVNARGGHYGNALQAASARGHEKMVQMLMDAGAEVNAQGGWYGNALQAASINDYENVVQMLIDVGAEVNAQGGEYGTALQAASARDHEKVVQILINAGAEVNAQGGWYGNALHAASARDHEKVVQMLIDAGAEVNAQGGWYGNALQAASINGYKKVVQMLMNAGAEINAQGGEYGNALQAASYSGNEKVVQMLIDAGAEVNAQGGHYGNALQAASARGHEKMVQMLMDAGAEVNAQGGWYGNALQAASINDYEKVVQMLIDAGAKVNASEETFSNAL